MKRRWKQTAGFTLVELIVVIAILGILAGVAVPTYSGYVKKANKAADDSLLTAVNSAFAAACIQENMSHTGLSNVELQYTKDNPITGVTIDGTDFEAFKG